MLSFSRISEPVYRYLEKGQNMSENNLSIIPDVVTPISDAIQSNIPETAKQTDGAISTVVGFFNNVCLG